MPADSNPPEKLPYRADIDGLRAVAVLLVVFNHVGMGRFPGGFIGVDVFFVISGYLIGSHILSETDAGCFSITRFYVRRVRRIMPALLVMLLLCSPLVYVFFFPMERWTFAQTEMGALVSVSNILLSHQPSYFSPNVRTNPFLHTWSLGVEEQFYIVFPLLLLVLTRWARQHLRIILCSLTLPLFVIAWYGTAHDPVAAFYLSPFRAWELLLGALAAASALPALRRYWLRNLASVVGLLLILLPGVFYSDTTLFPGPGAIAPCLGALLIIMAGEHGSSVVGHTLAWRPVRFLGLISYSLYLWHWPIQVFQATQNILLPDRYPAWAAKLAVILASLIAGTLSWRYVERPFRTGLFRGSRTWLFSITGALFTIVFAFTFAVIRGNGWGIPHMPPTRAVQDLTKALPSVEQVPWDTCLFQPETFPALYKNASQCLTDDPLRPRVLILGDSHAGAIYWGFKNTFPDLNISLFGVTRCTPTLIARNPECQRYSDVVFKDYLPMHPTDTVILIARWIQWDADAHLADTVEWLRQHRIKTIVIGPAIEFDAPLVRLIELSEREHDPALPGRHRGADAKSLDARMQIMARDQWRVPYISIFDDLCRSEVANNALNALGCPVFAAPGVSLQYDTDHLSPAGSMLFARIVRSRHQLPIPGN